MKKTLLLGIFTLSVIFTGCASVKKASIEETIEAKKFENPEIDKSGLYVYRDSTFGGSLKKSVYINDECLGETAPNIFFYEKLQAGKEYKISTESEFSNNDLFLKFEGGKNYFVRQYIKLGVFVGGANLEIIEEEKAKESISKLDMAEKGICN